jgi:hypothetical protein
MCRGAGIGIGQGGGRGDVRGMDTIEARISAGTRSIERAAIANGFTISHETSVRPACRAARPPRRRSRAA